MNFKFNLLREFWWYCKQNDIRCFLQGSALRAAYQKQHFNPEWDQLTVAVTAEDFRKLHRLMRTRKFMKRHPNRVLESLLTNDKFPGLYAKFVATDTLHLDFRDDPTKFVNKGLAITVLILINYPRQLKQTRGLKLYLSDNTISQLMVKRSGKIRRKAFETYLDQWSSESEPSGFITPQGRTVLFSKGFWKSPVVKWIDGYKFLCPKRLIRSQPERQFYTLDTIHSEYISFDEFRALCDEKGIDLKSVYKARQEHRAGFSGKIAAGRKNKRYYNAAFYSTMIRKETSERIAACSERDLDNDEYRGIIQRYLNQMLAQSKNGITPYISYGVFIDAIKLYVQQNKKTFRSRKPVMKRMLNRGISKIPDSFFFYSPVVEDVCYSEKDIPQDPAVLRSELVKEVHALLK